MNCDFSYLADINCDIVFLGVRNETSVTPPSAYICKKGARPFCRFFYVKKGCILFNKGKPNEVKISAGETAYLPGGIAYVSEWLGTEAGEYISVNFTADREESGFRILKLSLPFCKQFEEILAEFCSLKPGNGLKVKSLFYLLLNDIVRYCGAAYNKTQNDNYCKIQRGILFLEAHCFETVNINTAARICGLCPTVFRKVFKNYTGKTPIEYKNHIRMSKAHTLLRTGEYTVAEAAEAVGCVDVPYFCKMFKRYTGITPKNALPQ